jgi:YVTN family beta-propeller protein
MRFLVIPALLTACAVSGLAQTADRVYTADQFSNTVSVIDPSSNTTLGVIRLGNPFNSFPDLGDSTNCESWSYVLRRIVGRKSEGYLE